MCYFQSDTFFFDREIISANTKVLSQGRAILRLNFTNLLETKVWPTLIGKIVLTV